MSIVFQDARYGLRMVAKNPGFAAAAVITLALAAVYCECSPETLRIPTKSFHP